MITALHHEVRPLLLDTQVALWWHTRDRRLTAQARTLLASAPSCHISAASTWEVAIKTALGKLRIAWEPGVTFASLCTGYGFSLLDVSHEDAWAVLDLPLNHADPFDRLIAASARRRGWTVVSADPAFRQLGVDLALL